MSAQATILVVEPDVSSEVKVWAEYGLCGDVFIVERRDALAAATEEQKFQVTGTTESFKAPSETHYLTEYLARFGNIKEVRFAWLRTCDQGAPGESDAMRDWATFVDDRMPAQARPRLYDIVTPASLDLAGIPAPAQGYRQYVVAPEDHPSPTSPDAGWVHSKLAATVHTTLALVGSFAGSRPVPSDPADHSRVVHVFSRTVGGGHAIENMISHYVTETLPTLAAHDVDAKRFTLAADADRLVGSAVWFLSQQHPETFTAVQPEPLSLHRSGTFRHDWLRYALAGWSWVPTRSTNSLKRWIVQQTCPGIVDSPWMGASGKAAWNDRHITDAWSGLDAGLTEGINARLKPVHGDSDNLPPHEAWQDLAQLATGLVDGGHLPQDFEAEYLHYRQVVLPRDVDPTEGRPDKEPARDESQVAETPGDTETAKQSASTNDTSDSAEKASPTDAAKPNSPTGQESDTNESASPQSHPTATEASGPQRPGASTSENSSAATAPSTHRRNRPNSQSPRKRSGRPRKEITEIPGFAKYQRHLHHLPSMERKAQCLARAAELVKTHGESLRDGVQDRYGAVTMAVRKVHSVQQQTAHQQSVEMYSPEPTQPVSSFLDRIQVETTAHWITSAATVHRLKDAATQTYDWRDADSDASLQEALKKFGQATSAALTFIIAISAVHILSPMTGPGAWMAWKYFLSLYFVMSLFFGANIVFHGWKLARTVEHHSLAAWACLEAKALLAQQTQMAMRQHDRLEHSVRICEQWRGLLGSLWGAKSGGNQFRMQGSVPSTPQACQLADATMPEGRERHQIVGAEIAQPGFRRQALIDLQCGQLEADPDVQFDAFRDLYRTDGMPGSKLARLRERAELSSTWQRWHDDTVAQHYPTIRRTVLDDFDGQPRCSSVATGEALDVVTFLSEACVPASYQPLDNVSNRLLRNVPARHSLYWGGKHGEATVEPVAEIQLTDALCSSAMLITTVPLTEFIESQKSQAPQEAPQTNRPR